MDLTNKTYYEVLGVPRDATTEEIREAYREIARVFHPDSNFYDEILDDSGATPPPTTNPAHDDIFKQITAAYTTLINPNKRASYTRKLPPELKEWEEEVRISDRSIIESGGQVKPLAASEKPHSRAQTAWGSFGQLQDIEEEPVAAPDPQPKVVTPKSKNMPVGGSASSNSIPYRNIVLLSLALGIALMVTFRLLLENFFGNPS